MPMNLIKIVAFGCLCSTLLVSPSIADDAHRLWVYAPVNFQVDQDVDRLIKLLARAKKAGYNGAAITDFKFGKLDERPDNYYRNLVRTRTVAEELELELIPLVMQIGYSNSLLQNNPNLAAGLPVKDCKFVVKQNEARPASKQNFLDGGDFEAASKNAPERWDWIDGFGTASKLDASIKHSGRSSLRMDASRKDEGSGGNCRVVRRVTLKPFHEYRLTLWVKSDGLQTSEFKFMPIDEGGRALNHANLGIKSTQDWTRHRVVFNSLEHKEVNVYLGLWGAQSGQVWIDDVQLEEVGGINLLRREGCPLRVRSGDGSVEYQEGLDFTRWEDPLLGRVPYAGEYDDDHEAPPIRLTNQSRIRDGDVLGVSYYHAAIIQDSQVCCSLVAEEVFDLLRREVIQIDQYLKPKRYFMSHDEIRVAGWDELAQGRPSGKLLADNVHRCEKLIHEICPNAEVMVWSDMFDPNHNAHDHYYLVHGTLAGSWQGLDESVSVVNWNGGNAKSSLSFFANRGHQQIIAGYYDDDVKKNVGQWKQAARGIRNVKGFMYTTWQLNYSDLEAFADQVRSNE
ncbi:hypothetical protein FHS27_003198 [Rhodopirellula rubra]|uniref:CBM-cenC domain-containing protein n=1 Tax=Aporhodopirellula rubra TaxID=980271 RepID=A0A7W5E158_9BACT|nr:hypothetical protein [Aporhodopirellula rubra]MBB3207377.1 hypothetical protein [Aporhodopirellula rubra]